MSSLASLTQGSPGSYFFELAGAAPPPGVPSQLQSPASVIPAVDGTVNLNLVSSAGVGDATLTISSTNGNSAAVDLISTAGGNTYITMGESGGDKVTILNASGTSGALAITNDTTGTPFFLVDTVNNNVSIGATSGGGVAVGTVTTQSSLIVKDAVGGANAVAISPTSASQSVIAQTVANGGVMKIGSSLAFPATLTVSDVPYLGAGNYVEVSGAAGQPPLFISGAQGPAGQCGIHPDCAPGAGQLLLGSDNTNASQIVIDDATITVNPDTTFNNAIRCASIINLTGTGAQLGQFGAIEGMNSYFSSNVSCPDNSTVVIPQPTGPGGVAMESGLYFIMGRLAGGGNTLSRPLTVSSVGYWSSSAGAGSTGLWTWGGGGCCPALVTAPPSYIGIQGGSSNLALANGGGVGAVAMDFTFQQIGGLLGGLG
jgi:hypothetical protein